VQGGSARGAPHKDKIKIKGQDLTYFLLDSGLPGDHPALVKAGEYMVKKQVVKPGDWTVKNPHANPGGWAFEFYNELYPDTDDTAEILIALDRIAIPDHRWKHKEGQRDAGPNINVRPAWRLDPVLTYDGF